MRKKIRFSSQSGVPVGTIISYSALSFVSSADEKAWLPCDGSPVDATKYPKLAKLMSRVPDLRDRFLTGAGLSYNLGNMGGENTHTLTIDEMPSHSHKYNESRIGSMQEYWSGDFDPSRTLSFRVSSNTSAVGGSKSHENRPPYYAVVYYIRAK